MKLREFVANSLPRVRGRKKKGQTTTSNPQASISAAAAAAAAVATSHTTASPRSSRKQSLSDVPDPASPKSGRQEGSGTWFSFSDSRFSFLEKLVGKDSPVKRLLETKDRRVAPKGDKYLEDKLRSSPRFCPTSATEPSSPYGGPRVRSPPLGEKPVFHSQHASPVSVCWASRERYSDWDCSSLHNAGYGGYPESLTSFHSTPGSQRGPRSRSRIRTNPWLPSPRPSPYSVRSLSSPCTSSRSPSPSSSPAPPSSSDSTSPLTSFSSDVSTKRESQLQRHRRHRRHHSEVKASELTRPVVFDPPLTDTEQYYSTLDSGIGDTAASSGEKDRHKVAASRKHRSSKRRSVERDLELVRSLASSSPKSKPKFRSKNRAPHQPPSKALIANRDSKFWDSDSSSRSPPGRSLHASKDSLHFDNFHADGYSIPNRSPRLPGTPREVVAGFFHGDFLCGADSADLCTVSGSHKSSVLSLCDDICIITSNIEQLAQNISSEYEEGLEVNAQPLQDNSIQDPEGDSQKELYNLDSENEPVTHKLDSELCSALDYHSFAGPLQCTLLRAEERESCEAQNDTSTDTPNTDLSSYEDTSTVDVAVQTDFADDEEEDVSLSDWLASTESGSDWVTSNGSGSDWPTSGGSDWQTGEGSGCATEEDEERKKEVEGEGEEEEERSLWVVEGSRLWMVPDIMQNSTDTGYSSLSRDGRVVTDDNNNNNQNNNNQNNNSNGTRTVSTVEDSSDSSSSATTTTTTTEDKMSKTSDSDLTRSEAPGAIPKSSRGQKLLCTDSPHSVSSRPPCEEACAQRLSCKLQFSIMGGDCHCSRSLVPCGKDKPLPPTRPRAKSDHCLDEVEFFIGRKGKALQSSAQRASKEAAGRHSDYDHVVPYPYDVRRFSDVDLPCDEREGSVSPCFYDSLPSTSEEAEACSRLCTAPLTSTPLFQQGEPQEEEDEEDGFYSLFPANSMTSDRRDVTVHAKASGSAEGRGQCGQAPSLALAPFRSRLSLRALEDLPCTGRPLQEVRASLEKEVEVLRQGRRLVSRKIREAREEEMVRQQQKLRFQRLLDIHRKRILLETLQDLRQRLESQSMRLQASYSTVLHLQKRGV